MDNLAVLMEAPKELCRENVGLINGYAAAFYKLAVCSGWLKTVLCPVSNYGFFSFFYSLFYATKQINSGAS